MGAFYSVTCPNCDEQTNPWNNIMLGCGLSYPEACQSAYMDIRGGKYGPEVKRKMFWMRRPAVYTQLAPFVCKSCGKWRVETDVRLCTLKKGRREDPGSSTDQERQRRVKVNMKALCYLDYDEYDVVWEKKNPCGFCGGETYAESDLKKLKCHHCGEPLVIRMEGCWD